MSTTGRDSDIPANHGLFSRPERSAGRIGWKLFRGKIGGALLVGLLLLIFVGGAALVTLREFSEAAEWRLHTSRVIEKIITLESLITDAETEQRSYLLTGDVLDLAAYEHAVRTIPVNYGELVRLTGDNPAQQTRLKLLKRHIDEKMASLEQNIRIRNDEGLEAVQQAIITGPSRRLMASIRAVVDEMRGEETALLSRRDHTVRTYVFYCGLIVVSGMLLAIGHVVAALIALSRDVTQRERYQQALSETQKQLEARVRELNVRNKDITLLSEMADQLQACTSLDEAFAVVGRYGNTIFPGTTGTVYVYTESRDAVESAASWGGGTASQLVFDPQDCWALRRGQTYRIDEVHPSVPCKHMTDEEMNCSLCIPMLAQGLVLGMLHLQCGDEQTEEGTRHVDTLQTLGTAVSEHIALALANLRLRETLRQQSIRDPLTSLYNRRYMEESLEREMRRAQRSHRPVGVIMVDLDHFKKLNDTYGHEAGDAVLRAVANLLQTQTRGEDIVCRYGGEELAIIFPETSLENTVKRAQNLCDHIRALTVRHLKSKLQVTASMGVAAFPEHGDQGEVLIRAADRALYRAKAEGRDRVAVAEGTFRPDRPPVPDRSKV